MTKSTRFVFDDPTTHPPHLEVVGVIHLTGQEAAHANGLIPPENYGVAMWDSEENTWRADDSSIERRLNRDADFIFWVPFATEVEDEVVECLEEAGVFEE